MDTNSRKALVNILRKEGMRVSEVMKKALTDKSARSADSMIKVAASEVAATESYWA